MSSNGKPNGVGRPDLITKGHSLTQNSDNNSDKRGRIENLRPWKPGQSGNPGGRPKKRPFTLAIEKAIDGNPAEIEEAVKHLIALAKGEIPFCNGGPAVAAFKLMREAIEGKDVQPVSGLDGGAIQVEYGSREDNAARIGDIAARAIERANRRRTL